jgi:MOSC domain
MHVVSVNVGLPREVEWKGRKVLTGIFKSPVHARVPVRRLNIDGDGQADLTVHGGPDKAVYAYPSEHYGPWAGRLRYELSPGNFGENLTTQGLLEDAVHIGDEFRVGFRGHHTQLLTRGFRAGSPRVIAHSGLPQIPACGFPASGSSSYEFAARPSRLWTTRALGSRYRRSSRKNSGHVITPARRRRDSQRFQISLAPSKNSWRLERFPVIP